MEGTQAEEAGADVGMEVTVGVEGCFAVVDCKLLVGSKGEGQGEAYGGKP